MRGIIGMRRKQMSMTDEELLIRCGFELKTPSEYGLPCGDWWQYPNGEQYSQPPTLDGKEGLGNLFEFVVPKFNDPVIKLYKPVLGGKDWACQLFYWRGTAEGIGDDPTQALKEACKKALEGE
jgi:hypothetical protein